MQATSIAGSGIHRHRNVEERNDELAERQVRAFMRILRNEYGLSDDTIRRIFARSEKDIDWARYIARTALGAWVTVMVGAGMYAIGWAVVHFIRDLNGL